MAIQINGINHFAISVADMEKSIEWYSNNFGFTIIDRSEIPGTDVKVALEPFPSLRELSFSAPQEAPTIP